MDSKVEQAREWVEEVGKLEGLMPGPRAAAEVIQSLPDQWVDADRVREVIEEARLLIRDGEPEIILNDLAALLPAPRPRTLPDTVVDGDKLREVINKILANTVHGTVGHQVAEDYAALIGELIPDPPLPTLADMTPEEREACQWMQADVKLTNGGSATCVIANPRMPGAKVRVWASHGGSDDVQEGRVTPLPDLPKLEWPDGGVKDVPIVDGKPAMPRPEDVPSGEAWLIAYEGGFHTALKADDGDDGEPWIVSFTPGGAFLWLSDRDVTIISRLVPESKENA